MGKLPFRASNNRQGQAPASSAIRQDARSRVRHKTARASAAEPSTVQIACGLDSGFGGEDDGSDVIAAGVVAAPNPSCFNSFWSQINQASLFNVFFWN